MKRKNFRIVLCKHCKAKMKIPLEAGRYVCSVCNKKHYRKDANPYIPDTRHCNNDKIRVSDMKYKYGLKYRMPGSFESNSR